MYRNCICLTGPGVEFPAGLKRSLEEFELLEPTAGAVLGPLVRPERLVGAVI